MLQFNIFASLPPLEAPFTDIPVEHLNPRVTQYINVVAPLKSKTISRKPKSPWKHTASISKSCRLQKS